MFQQFFGGIFQFTTSQGGRRCCQTQRAIDGVFQFTTSQGGRHNDPQCMLPRRSFNSRPHKEVDSSPVFMTDAYRLSIHDLTRRSTVGQLYCCLRHNIFQFTTSQGGRLCTQSFPSRSSTFNSRPHKEVDNRGLSELQSRNLSIHDLTRRSTTDRTDAL